MKIPFSGINFSDRNERNCRSLKINVFRQPDTCEESGIYAPIEGENNEVIFKEERHFNLGDIFPDNRDWIPTRLSKSNCSIIRN